MTSRTHGYFAPEIVVLKVLLGRITTRAFDRDFTSPMEMPIPNETSKEKSDRHSGHAKEERPIQCRDIRINNRCSEVLGKGENDGNRFLHSFYNAWRYLRVRRQFPAELVSKDSASDTLTAHETL
jgi:hypothetical protein